MLLLFPGFWGNEAYYLFSSQVCVAVVVVAVVVVVWGWGGSGVRESGLLLLLFPGLGERSSDSPGKAEICKVDS